MNINKCIFSLNTNKPTSPTSIMQKAMTRCSDNFSFLISSLWTICIEYSLWMLSPDQKITCSPVPVPCPLYPPCALCLAALTAAAGPVTALLSVQLAWPLRGRERESRREQAGSRAPVLAVCTSPTRVNVDIIANSQPASIQPL